jgi:TolB-like protein/DNA-binding winged helix-turn-helix (wHTH) protein
MTTDELLNYRFADLALDVGRRRVTRHGQSIELKALDFDLLRFLVESAPNVVNADVLAEKVWGRHFVSPENVAQRVMLLRQSLSDDAGKPRYIETVRNKGYRLIPIVDQAPTKQLRARHRHRLAPATAAVVTAIGLTAGAAYWLTGADERRLPSPNSVAVLPFENLSPDDEDAYFAAAIQDEIVSQLTKISGLRVIAVRRSDGDQNAIAAVGRDLDVATVLGGRVYSADGRVRVTPHLTDTATGVSRWSDSYDREKSAFLEIQADIALDVARALSLELSVAERRNVQRVATTNSRALDFYLVASAIACCSTDELRAVDQIDQALELDPAFKEAWVAKAHIRLNAAALDPEHADEHHRLGEQAAVRALELDSEFGAAHMALGQALLSRNDWKSAAAAFRRARSLNVPSAEMGSEAFLNLAVGKFGPVARDIFEQARAANPENAIYYRFLVFVYEGLRESGRATDLYDDAMRVFPANSREMRLMRNQRMHWLIGRKDFAKVRSLSIDDPFNAWMLDSLETPERARAELLRAYDANGPDNPNRYMDIALWAGHFGDHGLAFAAARKMADAGGGRMAYVWLPQFEPIRRLPEFKAYLSEIGMVEYWHEYGWPTEFCRPLAGDDFECD